MFSFIKRKAKPELGDLLREMFGAGAWCVDSVGERDGVVEVVGWAVAPGYAHDMLGFTLNGQPFDDVAYPLPREDIARMAWYVPGALESGFTCRMHRRLDEACPDGTATLKFVAKGTGKAIREEHDYYYDARADGLPLPPAPLRARVHGAPHEFSFRLEGYTNYMKLRLVLQRMFGRDYGDFRHILDWGCGCGRFLRYFHQPGTDTAVTGADVDREAVEWVAANLPFAKAVTLPLHPPSPIGSGAHDLIIGISIFTHLGEREQFEWLHELRRISAPGAVLLMSVHGEMAVSRQAWNMEKLQEWRKDGFLVGASSDLDGVLEEADYYKTTFHTRDYIEKRWSEYFDIVEIIPGCVGNLHDLVVMVRRQGN